jgi:hypothetical protein
MAGLIGMVLMRAMLSEDGQGTGGGQDDKGRIGAEDGAGYG